MKYTAPELDVIIFEAEDVITGSSISGKDNDGSEGEGMGL